MNLYKYHNDKESLLYDEGSVMAGMLDSMIAEYKAQSELAMQHNYFSDYDAERDYDIEEWLLNGDNSTQKDLYMDDYALITGVEQATSDNGGGIVLVNSYGDYGDAYDEDW
ncbi:MAG: hypothetical protein HOK52_06810 [Candidatus Marinimicrobia bacterium]|jgi:hypothetical protein|nr:hypothetical protein [Candidatus Neomarinimicrobiota bacterium]